MPSVPVAFGAFLPLFLVSAHHVPCFSTPAPLLTSSHLHVPVQVPPVPVRQQRFLFNEPENRIGVSRSSTPTSTSTGTSRNPTRSSGWRHPRQCRSSVTMAMSMSMSSRPMGCASTPLQKKSVAICGAGGYLGGTIFGFCQRASNLYGTGIRWK